MASTERPTAATAQLAGSARTFPLPIDWSLAEVLEHLGGIPAERVRAYPPPGTATEQDVRDLETRADRICELVDGVLVEKTMGYLESALAMALGYFLHQYLESHDLGMVLGEAGTLRVLPGQVRAPDVSFLRWERFPAGGPPRQPIPAVAPDLAVEILSEGNTDREMARKLDDYFRAGTRLVWYIDPRGRTARAYTAPDQCTLVSEEGSLQGGDVLPGFEMTLKDLFAKAERHGRSEAR